MKKDEALNYDPWQELSKGRQVKKVELDQALEKLDVAEEEAPTVKRQMLNQVKKLTKADEPAKPKTPKKKQD